MSAAREEVLRRVRDALRDVATTAEPPVPRDYREAVGGALVDRFVERASEYRAVVRRVAGGELRARIERSLAEHDARRVVIPDGLPEAWRPAGVDLIGDRGLTVGVLDAVDGVITGCALAIADTGTVVLDAGPEQGRRVITLLPDYHLCVVEAAQVVGSVPEAIARLERSGVLRRPLTFVSGPSATSDIELRRVEGVHGPRRLELLVTTPER
jgi:L-lactate dehydrogenase complex protein LldG